jgi:F-type H+-transporting ATPase subunit b
MERTLHDLAGLLLKAVPTLLLVLVLHFYLKRMFFRPLERVLKARYDATEGARKLAEESLARASEKAAEYEQAIRAARAEIYREQEQFRQQLRQQQAAAFQEARRNADELVKQAGESLAGELAEARQTLERESQTLAGRIVERILDGSVD